MGAVLLLIVLAALIYLLLGFKVVRVGGVGIVIWLGRRTGDVRQEGITWLPPLLTRMVTLYRRERQIDVPTAQYYTSDRVRIAFKTTLRVAVADPIALYDQGPGTYDPFTRDAVGGGSGGEEANVALRGVAQNSIRESVQSLRIEDVMFGGGGPQQALRERIRQGLGLTSRRWGLDILEVWLTDVDAEDQKVKQAVQAEVREAMEGKGRLAAWEAQIRKGGLFHKVALEMVEDVRRQTGQELPLEEAQRFLVSFYQNERALEVATRSAGGHNDLMSLFYLQYMGLPVPNQAPMGMSFAARPAGALAAPVPAAAAFGAAAAGPAPDGSFIIGREGDIVIDSDGVSRHHARLEVRGGRMSLTDLGSTNGTFVSGRGLAPKVPAPVGPGDTVRLGKSVSVTAEELAAAMRTGRLQPGTQTKTGDWRPA